MNQMKIKNDYSNEFFVCGNNGCKGGFRDMSIYPSMIDAWNDGWIMANGIDFVWICPECSAIT